MKILKICIYKSKNKNQITKDRLDFWDRYEEEEDMDRSIEMIEDYVDEIESDLEYLYRTSEQNNRKENAVKIAELEEELQSLKDELKYISR